MSKRCPDCGFVNDDTRIYCGSCGELLDPELRLLKDLNQHTTERKPTYKTPPPRREPVRTPRPDFDDDYTPPKLAQKKKKSNAGIWLVLGIILVVAGILILNYVI